MAPMYLLRASISARQSTTGTVHLVVPAVQERKAVPRLCSSTSHASGAHGRPVVSRCLPITSRAQSAIAVDQPRTPRAPCPSCLAGLGKGRPVVAQTGEHPLTGLEAKSL